MKPKHFITSLVLLTLSMQIRAFTIAKNTFVKIGKNTQVKLSNLDLHNTGNILGDTASLLIISTTEEMKITGQNFSLHALKVAGDVACEVPSLTLDNDLILQSGVFNIGENKLIIKGDLLGENEVSYVTASFGTIEKPLSEVLSKQRIKALGLEFTPMNSRRSTRIIRSHQPVWRSTHPQNQRSANRVYHFSTGLDITEVNYVALPHEIEHLTQQTLFVEHYDGWQKVAGLQHSLWSVTCLSVFAPNEELFFPKLLTPDKSTNHIFQIAGLEEYPNARLAVFNKNGKILYDACPYQNDLDGKNLPNGTYYYIFSESRNGKPVKRSFFEVVR